MISAPDERLPSSVDGLLALAGRVYAERLRLALGLGAFIFLAQAIVAFAVRGGSDPALQLRAEIMDITSVFTDALAIAAMALAAAGRVAAEPRSSRALLGAAVDRWLPVIGATMIVELVIETTLATGGFAPLDGSSIITLPLTWLLWGAMGLAGPVAALSSDRPAIATFTGFFRGLMLALAPINLTRTVFLAAVGVATILLPSLLVRWLHGRGIADVEFWAGAPLDALLTPAVAVLQTVFALDYARRIERHRDER